MSGVAWFVDGAYAFECWRTVCPTHRIDYVKFRAEVEDDAGDQVNIAYYFNANEDPPLLAQQGFNHYLGKAAPEGPAFRVVLGSLSHRLLEWKKGEPVVHPTTGEQYKLKMQKEVDVLLAFNLIRSQLKSGWKKLYLVAGDRDFFEVLRHLVENEGVELTVFDLRRGRNGTPTISGKYAPFARHIYFEDIYENLQGDQRESNNA